MKTRDRIIRGVVTVVVVWVGIIVGMGIISLMVIELKIREQIVSRVEIAMIFMVLISVISFIKGFIKEPVYSYWNETGGYWEK
jgi:hypothetical protein